MKKVFIAFLGIMIVFIAATELKFFHLEKNIKKMSNRIYLHKGGTPPNTIEAVKQSLNMNIQFVELDVYFIDGAFYLGHDLVANIKNHKTLNQLFDKLTDKKISYWIDLKNLKLENYWQVSKKIRLLIDKYNLSDRVRLESPEMLALSLVKMTGVPVLFWIIPKHLSRFFWIRNFYIKTFIAWFEHDYISMDKIYFSKKLENWLCEYNIHIFTANGDSFEKFNKNRCVNAIVTDEISHFDEK